MASVSYHSWHLHVDFGNQTQVLILAQQVLYCLKHWTSTYLLREGTAGHACNCTHVELEDNVWKLALSFHRGDLENKRRQLDSATSTFLRTISAVCILLLINLFGQFFKNVYFICVSILVPCT